MKNLQDVINDLDYKNKSIVSDLIHVLADMQEHSNRDFKIIKHVGEVTLPSGRYTQYYYEGELRKQNSISSLDNAYKKIVDVYKSYLDSIETTHNSNEASIKNNMEIRHKIGELMNYIGIRKEYTTTTFKGTKCKSEKHTAGYLSDLNHFCIVDDGYNHIKSTLTNELTSIKRVYDEITRNLKNVELEQSYLKEFNVVNYKMKEHDVLNLSNEFALFTLKQMVIEKYDPEFSSHYMDTLRDLVLIGDVHGVQYDIELEESMIISDYILKNKFADDDLILLKSRYSVYNLVHNKMFGVTK